MSRCSFVLGMVLPLALSAQTYSFKSIAGGGLPTNVPATSVDIGSQGWTATDAAGNVYISLASYNIIVTLSANGFLTLVAGNGAAGDSGDGGPATGAQIQAGPIAIDPASGNLYLASGSRIRQISNGMITTVAGTGVGGFSGDGGPAVQAGIGHVNAIACDYSGNIYFAESDPSNSYPVNFSHSRVREISGGVVTTVAGNGATGSAGDGGPAAEAELSDYVPGLALDRAGNLFIADNGNYRIREVTKGVITTFAGSTQSSNVTNGDGGPVAGATFAGLGALAFDSLGDLFLVDGDTIREVSGGIINTVAGKQGSFSGGDGGPATAAGIGNISSIAVNPAGDLFLFDSNNSRLREVSAGTINAVAGNGGAWTQEGAVATRALLPGLNGIAVDASGKVYFSAYGRIAVIGQDVISTYAGNGQCAYPFGTILLNSSFVCAESIAFDAAGDLYLLQGGGIYKISQGSVSMVPGSQQVGYFQSGIAVDPNGNIYITDTEDELIQKLSNGTLTTFAGVREVFAIASYENAQLVGFSGDFGLATGAQLNYPNQIAIDSHGTIYFTDSQNNRVRAIANGIITTVAGNGSSSFSGDGGPAVDAGISFPTGVAVDASGNLYVGDSNGYVRKISGGIITSIAGTEPSPQALFTPQAVTLDSAGDVYFIDGERNQIDELIPAGPSCSYTVGKPASPAPMGGGAVSIAVQTATGCNWVVSNLPSWITASTSPSGASLTIAANTGAMRSATVLVAGQPVILAQDGSAMTIAAGGVVNAADFSSTVAPGSIVAVFGNFPVDQPELAAAVPLPFSLDGVSLTFPLGNNAPTQVAGLFYAGPNQINAQIPWNLVNAPSFTAVAVTGYGASVATTLNVAEFAPGIFAINGQGTGKARS